MRRFLFRASAAFLIFLGLSGLQSCISDWPLASGFPQRLENVGQAVFGVLGVLAGVGSFLGRPWAAPLALAFAISAGVTAGLTTLAWGGAGVASGIGSAGLGFLLGGLLYFGVTGSEPRPEKD